MNFNYQISSIEPQPEQEDPGAYPIPFGTRNGVELGSRLDSISPELRYWAVNPKRANAQWVSTTTRSCMQRLCVPSNSTMRW